MITCGNCKQSHSTVADVKDCYANFVKIPGLDVRVRRNEERADERRFGVKAGVVDSGAQRMMRDLSPIEAGIARRNEEFARAERAPQERWDRAMGHHETFTVADSGIYMPTEGNVYKVYQNQEGTRMLCKRLNPNTGSWEYKGMAHRFVEKRSRISQAEAEAFGKIYGICAICGRTLTDENSIAQGIGPVCIKKMGW